MFNLGFISNDDVGYVYESRLLRDNWKTTTVTRRSLYDAVWTARARSRNNRVFEGLKGTFYWNIFQKCGFADISSSIPMWKPSFRRPLRRKICTHAKFWYKSPTVTAFSFHSWRKSGKGSSFSGRKQLVGSFGMGHSNVVRRNSRFVSSFKNSPLLFLSWCVAEVMGRLYVFWDLLEAILP